MKKLIIFASLFITLDTNSTAQDYGSYSYAGTDFYANNNSINVAVMNNLIAKQSPEADDSVAQPQARAGLTFAASAARTRANLAAFANKTRKTDPQTAAQMDELFASGDIIGQIGQGISPYGLSTSNVADTYAVYWINAWEASRGIVGAQETRQRAQAVKAQAARGLAASPEFASATDAQKQEFAEAMLVQAAMISSHMEAAASDPAQLRAVGEAVSKGAKAAGLDLSIMDLTPTGFVPAKGRKGSDASGAIGDGAKGDTVLVSTKATTPANGDAPANPLATYALIAAAGGAGLGGVYLLGKAAAKKG